MAEVTELDTETAIESKSAVRDNTVERKYWAAKGIYLHKGNPRPLPEFLYHKTWTDPRRVKSIKRFGLVPRRSLDVPRDWKWGRRVVFLGDNPREDALDPVVVVRPDPLDPNWITTEISEEPRPADAEWGHVWMHVGRIPKKQIVEIRPAKEIDF